MCSKVVTRTLVMIRIRTELHVVHYAVSANDTVQVSCESLFVFLALQPTVVVFS
jgi:hypothetical protein